MTELLTWLFFYSLCVSVFDCCPSFVAIKVTLCITVSIFLFSMAWLFLSAWLRFARIVPGQLCPELHHTSKKAVPLKSQGVISDRGLNYTARILCQAKPHFKAASADSGFSLHESPYGTEPEITGLSHPSVQSLSRMCCQSCSMQSVQ